jgi:hypothetical protein
LGSWMPFGQSSAGIERFLKVSVSEASARRKTEAAGQAYVAVQTAKVEALEARPPESPRDEPKGPDRQLLSADGAMVPLVGKRWGESRRWSSARSANRSCETASRSPHRGLSYFSRMADHETFGRLATVETFRRGTSTAGLVCAVNDGAGWSRASSTSSGPTRCGSRLRPQRRASLEVAQAIHGVGTEAAQDLAEGGVSRATTRRLGGVLRELRTLAEDWRESSQGETLEVVRSNLEYFEKRREQIATPVRGFGLPDRERAVEREQAGGGGETEGSGCTGRTRTSTRWWACGPLPARIVGRVLARDRGTASSRGRGACGHPKSRPTRKARGDQRT